jgi:hypothetical protein
MQARSSRTALVHHSQRRDHNVGGMCRHEPSLSMPSMSLAPVTIGTSWHSQTNQAACVTQVTMLLPNKRPILGTTGNSCCLCEF